MANIGHKWLKDINEKKKVSYDKLDKIIQTDLVTDMHAGPERKLTEYPEPEGWDQTDSILIECQGFWWLHSNSKPQWNAEGSGIVGGRSMNPAALRKFWELKRKYGNPPFDLIYRFEPVNLKKFRLAGENTPLE